MLKGIGFHENINHVLFHSVPNIYNTNDVDSRTILEFKIENKSQTSSRIYLNFLLRNIDRPQFGKISIHSYVGNGNAEISDYYNTNSLVTSFNDEGNYTADRCIPTFYYACEYEPFSIDVTEIYNMYISGNKKYLGFVFSIDGWPARYDFTSADNHFRSFISLSTEKVKYIPNTEKKPDSENIFHKLRNKIRQYISILKNNYKLF